MADFEPPSFSLGLDLDSDSEPQSAVRGDPSSSRGQQSSTRVSFGAIEEEDDGFESSRMDPKPQFSDPPQTLKRLRRGPIAELTSASRKRKSAELWRDGDGDDEIEEFSSPEGKRRDEPPSTLYHSACSSSKFPLHAHGVLTTQSASQSNVRKGKPDTTKAPASASLETSNNKLRIPKLTVSPLRMFQLLDSDTDSHDTTVSEDANGEANKIESTLKDRQSNSGHHANVSEQKGTKASVSTSQTDDLWKDFCPEKSFHIPTPALDEVCEEYFRSVKNKNEAQKLRSGGSIANIKGCQPNGNVWKNDGHHWDSSDTCPPAHRYFFHDDPRVQKLVCSRLPHFYPLVAVDKGVHKQPRASVIDYMDQFSHEECSRQQGTGKINAADINLTKGRKKSRKSNAGEPFQGSGSWVNPRNSGRIPKDAAKRRVHAVGQSAGRWYTGPDGQRIYVTRNGQELTGQIAYRHYKKESGAGSKRSKKKAAANKKTKA